MAYHDFLGSDETFRPAREEKIHGPPACCNRVFVSPAQNDVILNNTAIALISLRRYEEPLACSQKAIVMNSCRTGIWTKTGIALEKPGQVLKA